MKAIKGGWVGQTFALATSGDSGGRKARVRRSKEERKAMVESFVKRYQRSNNGNFPSLNLTHKEVGGSFYTVREIVREIIQENRVLGPAKLSIEEQNNSAFLEQYPLESISTEPLTYLFSSVNVTTDLHQDTSEDHVVDPDGQFSEPEYHRLKEDQVVNANSGSLRKDKKSEESSITLSMPIHDENTCEQQFSSSFEQFSGSKTQHFEIDKIITGREVIVQDEESGEPVPADALLVHHEDTSTEQIQSPREELPVVRTPMSGSGQVASGSSQESLKYEETGEIIQMKSLVQESVGSKKDGAEKCGVLESGMNRMKADIVVETFPLRSIPKLINGLDERSDESHEITNILEQKTEEELKSPKNGSIPRNDKVLGTGEVLPMEKNKEMMDERGILVASLKCSNGSTTQKNIIPSHSKISELDKASSPVGAKFENVPNSIHHEKLNRIEKDGSAKQLIPVEAATNKNRLNVHDSGSNNGSSPTLDRINLETWEGRSRKSAEPKTNPLVAFFVSLVTGIVKFLTE